MKTEQCASLGPEWIVEGEGKWSRPLQFLPGDTGWVELMRLAPGVRLGLHRHTGHVHAFNLEGSRQLGTGEQLGPHAYVYEPEGNVDWWQATGDKPLVVFVVVTGAVEYLAQDGTVLRRITVRDRREDYLRHCASHGLQPVLLGQDSFARQ
ncbi:anti-sigma factor [Duganella sp. FT3S]|uniref:Anti-sigma factor n=1 Tax=Rugamonas fusca TaxID=2758568 RepID=A0A7W2EKU7_9BURK|nr:anti-sigma factor [Rugamonas fusca]MBA5607753.1 anti-sigma factor [Rugamonas fusca]